MKPYQIDASGNLSPTCYQTPDGQYHCATISEAFGFAMAEGQLDPLIDSLLLIFAMVFGFVVLYKLLMPK